MGTKNIVGVFYNGKYRICQWQQFNGYPESMGLTVLKFVRNKTKLSKLRRVLDNAQEKIKYTEGWDVPKLLRECGVSDINHLPESLQWHHQEILDTVASAADSSEPVFINLDTPALESPEIEWAYIVDLDDRVFQVYSRRADVSHKPRFPKSTLEDEEEELFPPYLDRQWPLNYLPGWNEFLSRYCPYTKPRRSTRLQELQTQTRKRLNKTKQGRRQLKNARKSKRTTVVGAVSFVPVGLRTRHKTAVHC